MSHKIRLYAGFGACLAAATVFGAASTAAASTAAASTAAASTGEASTGEASTGEASPTATAAPKGWHLTDFSDTCDQTPYQLAVLSSDAAWMMAGGGLTSGQCAADGIDVSHWNGNAWTLLPPTTALTNQTGTDLAIAASSTRNVWIFPLVFGPTTAPYAAPENWDGSTWTAYSLPMMNVVHAVAFSRSNAWVFGPKITGSTQGLWVAAHFNGSSWQRVRMPGEPLAASAQAANDIWAIGPSNKTAAKGSNRQVRIAMHWDGHRWQTLSTPRIRVARKEQVLVNGAVAIGQKNFWWSYSVLTTSGKVRPGGRMLHWNGRKWREVKLPTATQLFGTAVAAEDGAGGVWLTSITGNSSAPVTVAYHYSAAGHWSRDVPPIPAGFNSTSLSLFWIPHTRSLWGVGSAHASSTNAEEGIVERYYAP
jgi:hypothetical protein